jgi:hypothetical protein
MENVPQPDLVLRLEHRAPVQPTCQTVACIVPRDLINRQLVLSTSKLVAPVLEPVRPWEQRLPAAAVGHVVERIPVDYCLAA